MKLHILFMQRKERYPGQFGPEALVCWDEFTVEENPEGFAEEIAEAKNAHEEGAAGFAVVRVEVDGTTIRQRCLGAHEPIPGKIADA